MLQMEPDQSQGELLRLLSSGGRKLSDLLPADGIDTMLRFYAKQRVERCVIEDDGDMLLYEWGVYSFNEDQKETYQVSITRQFMLPDEDEPYQLSLTFHYESESVLRAIGNGNRWCASPDDLGEFEALIKSSFAYISVSDRKPMRTEVMYSAD